MLALALVLPALVLAPFFCTDVGPGWPTTIRDRLLRVVAWTAAVMLTFIEPGFGLLAAVFLCHWQRGQGTAGVIGAGAGIGLYLAARAVPPDLFPVLRQAILWGVAIQLALVGVQLWIERRSGASHHVLREAARGTVGNRVVLGCLCAMAAALGPVWALPLFGGGVLLSRSFSAVGSLAAGLCWRWPWLTPAVLAAAPLAWALVQRNRPSPEAGARSRLTLARLCLHRLWHASWRTRLIGFGPGAFFRHARWWTSTKQTHELFKHAHNDLVQGAFEYGLLGVAGAGVFALMVLWRGGVGDPVTAAIVAGLLNALVQFPLYLPHVLVPLLVLAGMAGR